MKSLRNGMYLGWKREVHPPIVNEHLRSLRPILGGDASLHARTGCPYWETWFDVDPIQMDWLEGYLRNHGATRYAPGYWVAESPEYRLTFSALGKKARLTLVDFLAWEYGGDNLASEDDAV